MGKKKKKINRSQAIRDILAKDLAAKPKAIQAELAKKGIKVSASLINAVKYGKSKPGKRGRKAGSRSSGGETSFDALLGAKALADKLGGVRRARQALDMLGRLS